MPSYVFSVLCFCTLSGLASPRPSPSSPFRLRRLSVAPLPKYHHPALQSETLSPSFTLHRHGLRLVSEGCCLGSCMAGGGWARTRPSATPLLLLVLCALLLCGVLLLVPPEERLPVTAGASSSWAAAARSTRFRARGRWNSAGLGDAKHEAAEVDAPPPPLLLLSTLDLEWVLELDDPRLLMNDASRRVCLCLVHPRRIDHLPAGPPRQAGSCKQRLLVSTLWWLNRRMPVRLCFVQNHKAGRDRGMFVVTGTWANTCGPMYARQRFVAAILELIMGCSTHKPDPTHPENVRPNPTRSCDGTLGRVSAALRDCEEGKGLRDTRSWSCSPLSTFAYGPERGAITYSRKLHLASVVAYGLSCRKPRAVTKLGAHGPLSELGDVSPSIHVPWA
ncbi:hypothetical protein HU200_040085 [Digitaria exilis]|uniref:Uncharacterized protein n=1 Tax=Digitaria exilis TaxID=1010633 RepID=A0A835B6K1_9POAL|nr:hypothetical protein HU200_040085 [Digitaria exilis]